MANIDAKTIEQLHKTWGEQHQNVSRQSWDKYFLIQAIIVSSRSLDAQTQCGCVLVAPDKNIIATGYNSFIPNIDDSVLPNLRPSKYDFMQHAEKGVITACAKQGKSMDGATCYTTGRPCLDCFQDMYQCGVNDFVWLENYHNIKMTQGDEYNAKWHILHHLMKNVSVKSISFNQDEIEKIQNFYSYLRS